ncbi:MAG: molybdate ABC transporter permease subunit [Actinobacteria bacterium]|nr:MAG: molybdate ABC transporter permease subunit [Actinomycetota bacterium]
MKGKTEEVRPGRRVGEALASGFAVAALALLAGFISLPLISLVVWTVDEGSWRAMASPVALDALFLSIKTTAITMVVMLVVGTPAAYALARTSFPGKRLVNTLIDIPAVLPPSAAGIALLLAFGKMGLLGEQLSLFGIQLTYTTAAVVIAELFVASHFYVRQAAVRFGRVDRDVEDAAMVDGADRVTVFRRITLPLAAPALVAGAVTAWARALGEFGGTIIFAGNFAGTTQTMPLAIFAALERDFDAAVALAVLVLGFSFVVILTAKFLTRRAEEIEG